MRFLPTPLVRQEMSNSEIQLFSAQRGVIKFLDDGTFTAEDFPVAVFRYPKRDDTASFVGNGNGKWEVSTQDGVWGLRMDWVGVSDSTCCRGSYFAVLERKGKVFILRQMYGDPDIGLSFEFCKTER